MLSWVNPLRIMFAGSGEFGLPSLRALRGAGHEIVRVISQPDRPAGRGGKVTPTPISRFALAENLPLLRTENINSEVIGDADLMVVIAFGQKIGPDLVNRPRLGSINLHASRLPKYRGAAPINWAILRGETTTGNSVIRLAQRMDAGMILAQSELNIGESETAGELHDRLAEDGGGLVLQVVEALSTGTAIEQAQDESLATAAPKLSREMARLEWTQTARALACHIRGLSPWPGCRVRLIDASGNTLGRLVLVRARSVGATDAPAGVIDNVGNVGAADQHGLEIMEVQPEGKRPMSLQAYRNGHAWEPGMRLDNVD